jgi:hypothetical protein
MKRLLLASASALVMAVGGGWLAVKARAQAETSAATDNADFTRNL